MRVILEESLFQQGRIDQFHPELLALFQECSRTSRHTIEIDSQAKNGYQRWCDAESPRTREMCGGVLRSSVKLRARRTRTRTLRVADIGAPLWSEWRLSPSDALLFLRQPLKLLVENALAERNFLLVITRLVDGFDLAKLLTEKSVEIDTGGGIDSNRQKVKDQAREPEKALRLWVMCDSDAKQPWMTQSQACVQEHVGEGARKLKDACDTHKIPLHVLQRRAIDNYVPPRLLELWSFHSQDKRTKLCQAFARLSETQRHHYNMKDGFEKDEKRSEYPGEVGCLYHGLSPKDFQDLRKGFNNKTFSVTDLFDETMLHDGCGKLRVQESWLQRDGQAPEARRIVESIQELL